MIFELGNSLALAEKMKYPQANPSLAEGMGRNAGKRVDTESDAATHYRRLMEVYGKVL
jgi:hypothetical protein